MSCGRCCTRRTQPYLDDAFYKYEQQKYEVAVRPRLPLAVRFQNIIETMFQKTGNRRLSSSMSMILHCSILLKIPEHDACTAIYKSVLLFLKKRTNTSGSSSSQASPSSLKFLFSVLNNLSNISFDAPYATICGISKQEVAENFIPEIEAMGKKTDGLQRRL